MPKRNLVVDDDDELISNTSSAKRARTADSGAEWETRPRLTREEKGKGKARRDEEVSEDDLEVDGDDDDQEYDDEDLKRQQIDMDDEQFEAKYGAALRAHLESKRKIHGGVAEHGVIEYIELHRFMCHRFLRFTFGPQINFIIGHNGSGKSAVLSAITIALGGKTMSTGRGTGLKSFIQEGQTNAEVTIHIKNKGEEAFKPKDYGETIVITRRWTRDSAPVWKIKSKDGRVISTKKEELSAICDHMNIQVDNPMNVLTQDAARQFLSASSPQEKYKLFLRGTQLTQLSEEYDLCFANVKQTQKLLVVKKEALPDLKAKFDEATARFKEAEKAREQKKRADELKKELAWSHVATKEEEMSKQMEEAAKLARRLPKIEEGLQHAEDVLNATSEEVSCLEAEYHELGSVEDLIEQRKGIQEEMKTKKETLRNLNADLKQMNVSLETTNSQIQDIEKQIEDENRRMVQQSQGKHDETLRNIENQKHQIADCEQRLKEIMSRRRNLSVEMDTLQQEGTKKEGRLTQLKEQIKHCEQTIRTAREKEQDALVPYGRQIKAVVEKIKSMHWFGDSPLGPLGQHVKAKEPGKWGEILRNQLGGYLTAFAVTDARDRGPLKKLFLDSGNPHIVILIYEKDLFDFRSGEPPEDIPTVLRALEINDPYVLRLLINQAHIENQVLASTRREAENTLRTMRTGGSAWSLDRFSVRVFSDGGVASYPLNLKRTRDASSLLLTGRDAAADIRHISEEKSRLENEGRQLHQEIEQMRAQWNHLKREIDKTNAEEATCQREQASSKRQLAHLVQEANEDLPAGLTALEASKLDAEREKEGLMQQGAEVLRQKTAIDDEQKTLLEQLNVIKDRLNDYERKRNEKNKLAEAAAEKRLNAQKNKKYFQDKYNTEKKKVDTAEAAVKLLEEEFTIWTEKASEYCERVPNPRKSDEVKRLLDSMQKALKDREKTQGASVEELAREVNKTKEDLEKTSKEHRQMVQLNKALKQSLMVRIGRWHEFRLHIALRCKHVFQYHLSQRGYYGKILFNHDGGTLQLRVQTDDQLQTEGTKEKDPRSLSGGEKSFSTICLLLSLWESIGCPLRCLDEFDVFMDAVNRRISMKMMIETANNSDRKQYILITPQDMTNVILGPSVKVHRMQDPERGNGTLPFASQVAA